MTIEKSFSFSTLLVKFLIERNEQVKKGEVSSLSSIEEITLELFANWLDRSLQPVFFMTNKPSGISFISPPYETKCQITYCLKVDNKPGCQTIWLVYRSEDKRITDLDHLLEAKIVSDISPFAYQVIPFDFDIVPDCYYYVVRDENDVNDTALGDEIILSCDLIY